MLIVPSSPPRPLPYCWAHLQGHTHTVGLSSPPPVPCLDRAGPILSLSVCVCVCLSLSLCALWHDLHWVGLALTPPLPYCWAHLQGHHTHTVGPSPPPLLPLHTMPRLCWTHPISLCALWQSCTGLALALPSPHPHPHCWFCPLSFETTSTLRWTHPLSLASDKPMLVWLCCFSFQAMPILLPPSLPPPPKKKQPMPRLLDPPSLSLSLPPPPTSDTPHTSLALLLLFPGHAHTAPPPENNPCLDYWTPPLSPPPTSDTLYTGLGRMPPTPPFQSYTYTVGPIQGHTHIVEPALSLKPGLHSSAPPPTLLAPPHPPFSPHQVLCDGQVTRVTCTQLLEFSQQLHLFRFDPF